jgi:hypothetical protein
MVTHPCPTARLTAVEETSRFTACIRHLDRYPKLPFCSWPKVQDGVAPSWREATAELGFPAGIHRVYREEDPIHGSFIAGKPEGW